MGGPFKPSYPEDQKALAAALEAARGALRGRDRSSSLDDVPDQALLSRQDLARKARALLAGRRARDRLFGGSSLFGEPAWDIMLDLFAAEVESRKVSVSSATSASCVAPTTGLRWIEKLVQMGFLEREPDHLDRRRFFVRLSDRATELVRLAIIAS